MVGRCCRPRRSYGSFVPLYRLSCLGGNTSGRSQMCSTLPECSRCASRPFAPRTWCRRSSTATSRLPAFAAACSGIDRIDRTPKSCASPTCGVGVNRVTYFTFAPAFAREAQIQKVTHTFEQIDWKQRVGHLEQVAMDAWTHSQQGPDPHLQAWRTRPERGESGSVPAPPVQPGLARQAHVPVRGVGRVPVGSRKVCCRACCFAAVAASLLVPCGGRWPCPVCMLIAGPMPTANNGYKLNSFVRQADQSGRIALCAPARCQQSPPTARPEAACRHGSSPACRDPGLGPNLRTCKRAPIRARYLARAARLCGLTVWVSFQDPPRLSQEKGLVPAHVRLLTRT